MKRALLFGMAALLAFTSAQANSPNTIIEEAVAILDEKLTPNKAMYSEDRDALYALVDEILLPRFDRRYAAQLVLAKHWKSASKEQQDAFIAAYYQNLLRRYSEGLLEFDQSRVEVLPFKGDETKKRVMVKTRVRLDDGKKVPVDYGVVRRESGWKVFDVRIEGISYVTNSRVEFDAEINRSGLDAVIERLENEATANGD